MKREGSALNLPQESILELLASPVPSDETGETEGINQLGVEHPVAGKQAEKTVVWWSLQGMSRHRLLSSQEEIELGHRIQQQDDEALISLVAGNLRLVVSIATRHVHQGMDLEDLIQEGNLGLMIAAKKFDPAMGNRFSTYATWWIRSRSRARFQTSRERSACRSTSTRCFSN
jgi:DNA-directed RNA polymerase sigma subunit (sigma70/sigma32)